MRSKSLTPFGETEMEILHHVWDLGRASVADVRDLILQERDVAYTTVMTVMKNLAEKGYLDYEKKGNSYVYFPKQDAEEVQHGLIRTLVRKVFKDSPAALVQTLVEHEDLSDDERREILTLIQRMEEDDDGDT